MKKNIDELSEIDKRLKDIETKKKLLTDLENKKRKKDERRRRTHRLVETGAMAEDYFEIYNLSLEERKQLFMMFATFIKANKPNNLKK